MSGLINITGTDTSKQDDPTYRYKMPRLVAKVEGRGNGIKTVVVNMTDIAESLNRPPTLPTKFFGCELGAQTRWEQDVEKATVNGAHTAPTLQHLLNVFIDKFVLCPKCKLPETALVVKKGLIQHKCSACGAKEPVDMSHKLCTFILKEAASAAAALGKDDKASKKAKKDAKKAAAAAAAAGAPADGAAAAAPADGEKAAKKDKKEKKEKKEKSSKDKKAPKEDAAPAAAAAADSDDGSSEDEAPAKPAAAAAASSSSSSSSSSAAAAGGAKRKSESKLVYPPSESEEDEAAAGGDDDEHDAGVADQLRGFLAGTPAPTTDAIVAEVRRLQAATASPPTARAALFARAVLDGHAEGAASPAHLAAATLAATKARRTIDVLTALLTGKDAPAAGPSQAALLEAIGRIAGRNAEGLSRALPVMLQALYDADVLEEDAILAWAAGKSGGEAGATARAAARPFVEWLQAAEEDDDEDEDDDEEDDE